MKKVIIIGAGVSGLTAGIYGQKMGLETEIYEMHSIPGGECTGWSRKGYHFDNCIHWLTGTKEGSELNDLWKEIGALDKVRVIEKDYIINVNKDNKSLFLYTNLDMLRNELNSISPGDKEAIDEFIKEIKAFETISIPINKPVDHRNIMDKLRLVSDYKDVGKYMKRIGKLSVKEYSERFKSELIRTALTSFMPDNFSAIALISSIATITSGNGGFPEGGSLKMAKRIEEKYRTLGGKIVYNSKVKKIIIEENIAKGIELENGKIIYGDYIIAAGDGIKLMKNLLEDKYKDDYFDELCFNNEKCLTHSSIEVSLGIKCDLSNRPHLAVYEIEPLKFANTTINKLGIKHYCSEKEFAPKGCSVVKVNISTYDYEYFKELRDNNIEKYKEEKSRIGNEVVKNIEIIYPEVKDFIEVVDVATPVTYERYCDAYKGAWMGFDMTPEQKQKDSNGKVDGIENLYIAGQWLWQTGGLPTALASGKWSIQRICKDNKIKWR